MYASSNRINRALCQVNKRGTMFYDIGNGSPSDMIEVLPDKFLNQETVGQLPGVM